jgi:predicted RecA/RadA family phage recombinase
MKNFIQKGVNLTLPTPEVTVSGQALLIGSIFGVASNGGAAGENVDLVTQGVFTLPKAAVTMPLGCKVYWDNTAKLCTTVSAGNTLIGSCVDAIATVALTAPVRLNGSFQ